MSISRSNINLQVTRGNNMKNLKDIPAGNKGKGLSNLPTGVRNNMGFKKQGGKVNKGAFVAGAIGAGLGMKAIKNKSKVKPPKGEVVKGNTDSLTGKIVPPKKSVKEKKVIKRKGGGMAYQLYGGKVSNNGNQFVQSFYDKD